MTKLKQILQNQLQKEIVINSNFDSVAPAGIFSFRGNPNGLNYNYYGGIYVDNNGHPVEIADGFILLGNNAKNYICYNPTKNKVEVSQLALADGVVPIAEVTVNNGKITEIKDTRMHKYIALGDNGSGGGYTLPIASDKILGGVKVGKNLSITGDGVLNADGGGSSYTLPPATKTTLGGVKVGDNLTVDTNGLISAPAPTPPYTLPIATKTILGGVKQGKNITINADGTIDADQGSAYTLPIASATVLGGVKVGKNLTIDGQGVLNADNGSVPYTLPPATKTTLGGVKVGDNLSVDANGLISAPAPTPPYTLPIATKTVLGGVKAGKNVTINTDGTIDADQGSSYTLPIASATVLGGIKVGSGLAIDTQGVLSASGGGSGFQYLIEAKYTASPWSPYPLITYTVNTTEAMASIAFIPKGQGGFCLSKQGNNKLGTSATDLQIDSDIGATGIRSFCAGGSNTATGNLSISLGYNNNCTADNSVSFGSSNKSSGLNSTTIGSKNTVTSSGGVAIGDSNIINSSADGAVLIGVSNSSSGSRSITIGTGSGADSVVSTAIGNQSRVKGSGWNQAIGHLSNCNDVNSIHNYSSIFGNNSSIDSSYSTVIGNRGSDKKITNSFNIGFNSNIKGKQQKSIYSLTNNCSNSSIELLTDGNTTASINNSITVGLSYSELIYFYGSLLCSNSNKNIFATYEIKGSCFCKTDKTIEFLGIPEIKKIGSTSEADSVNIDLKILLNKNLGSVSFVVSNSSVDIISHQAMITVDRFNI